MLNLLDRAFLRLLGKSRWELLRIAMDSENRQERTVARLCLRMADAGKDDLSFRTAKNGKVYPINEETGTIAAGPMKGIKVGSGNSTGPDGEAKSESNGGSSNPTASTRSNYTALTGKIKKQADEISKAISSGKATLRESAGKRGEGCMNAHMPNTPEYLEHAKLSFVQMGYMPSHFSGDYRKYIPAIKRALKDRNAVYSPLRNGRISVKIDLEQTVGTVYDRNDRKGHSAHAVEIQYNLHKNDWHFYPCDMEDG